MKPSIDIFLKAVIYKLDRLRPIVPGRPKGIKVKITGNPFSNLRQVW